METLKPFSALTDAMSMEKAVGVPSILPMLLKIKDECQREIAVELTDSLKETSKEIRCAIWSYIEDRRVINFAFQMLKS